MAGGFMDERHNLEALGQKQIGQMRTGEPRRPGDKNSHELLHR
jgi:hypothetical protein